MIALAAFHNIYILIMAGEKLRPFMTKELSDEFILWFFVGGVFFAFIGVMDILSGLGLKKLIPWAWKTAFVSAVFTVACSAIGIAVFRQGPPIAIAFFGIIQIIPLILYRKQLQLKA
jgi:hypothetical protein